MLGRLLVLGAFLVGAAAFFVPFFNVNAAVTVDGATAKQEVSLSVMQIFQGASAFEDLAGGATIPDAQKKEIDSMLTQIRGILMIPFAPTALFLLVLLAGIKRFGRAHGVFALLIGLIGLAGWALISGAASESANADASFGIGLTLIMVGAVLGTVGGIAGIAKPEPKKA